MSRIEASDKLLVARFGSPHGVKGALRLSCFMDDHQALFALPEITDASGERNYSLRFLHMHKQQCVVQVEGCNSREEAKLLGQLALYTRRDFLPEPDEDDAYYVHDLIGMQVAEKGVVIGKVVMVHNFGAGDILDIAPNDGGASWMLSFTKETVPEIDWDAGMLHCVLPEIMQSDDGEQQEADPAGK